MFNYEMYQYKISDLQFSDEAKAEQCMCKFEEFGSIKNLEDARKLSEKLFPNLKEKISKLYFEELECTILNESNLYRITINSPKKFASYSFSNQK